MDGDEPNCTAAAAVERRDRATSRVAPRSDSRHFECEGAKRKATQRARIGERAAGDGGASGEAGGPITHGGSSSGEGKVRPRTTGPPAKSRNDML